LRQRLGLARVLRSKLLNFAHRAPKGDLPPEELRSEVRDASRISAAVIAASVGCGGGDPFIGVFRWARCGGKGARKEKEKWVVRRCVSC
jgi:hypothetical protein